MLADELTPLLAALDGAGPPVRAAAGALALRLVFLQLAEDRGLLALALDRVRAAADRRDQLLALFEGLHAGRGGRLFAPASAAIDAEALDDALIEVCLALASAHEGAEIEALGRLHEALRGGPTRRRTGTHYTPRALAEDIVSRALAPHGSGPSPVTVCDPAMGSGVFLLAASRLLGAPLGADGPLRVALTRIYGVDEDPMAVELARLSLWLETRASALRFDCFDHALRQGDALVGLELAQLRRLDWQPERGTELAAALVEDCERARASLRTQLDAIADDPGPRAAARRAALFAATAVALEPARVRGDQVIAAFFSSLKIRERRAALALAQRSEASQRAPAPAPTPLHWPLAFPQLPAAGVDVVVGNPPFAGKNGILARRGRAYLDWLKHTHPGTHGNADYAAHFFRRAHALIGERGTIGLVATNTIAQGDTRTTGLAQLLAAGCEIYDAHDNLEWPGAANVTVSIVHLAKGPTLTANLTRRLDGRAVTAIDSRLHARVERPDPVRLDQPRRAFIGTYLLGRGFVLTPAERDALLASDARNGARIRPYIGGEQLNSSPTQQSDRYAIDFGDLSLAEARAWPELLDIVRRTVKPKRERLGDNPDGRRRKARWWQHGRATPALHRALAPLERCLATSLVNKHLCFAFQPARRLFSHKLCVFALDSFAAFAVLQSRVHGIWARLLSSTMRNAGINYSPSDCFETFPWPTLEGERGRAVEAAGEQLERARARYMIDADLGLTKTYNALRDPGCEQPAIARLRELHVEVDRAVLAAYGWAALLVPAYRDDDPSFEDELVDRLYALNAASAS